MAKGILRRGRGFDTTQSSDPIEPGRLDRPTYLDEEPDREHIVRRGRGAPQVINQRARINSPPPGTNGGVKVGTLPSTPSLASQNQEPEAPKRRRIKPDLGVFTPRGRLSAAQQQTVDKPPGRKSDNSGMDISQVTRPSFRMQTLSQALTSPPYGDGKPMEQAPVSGRLEDTPRPPTDMKAPRATPASTEVLTEALKTLPPRASQNDGFRNSAIPRGPAAPMPAAPMPVAEVVTEGIPVEHEPTVDHSPETTAVVVEETLRHEPVTSNLSGVSVAATGVTADIEEAEELLANTDNTASATEELESYQLGADERFASESSDESESVTSTINDYDEVSENEDASGDEIVRKKVRKPKPVETSDGLVYYQVAVDEAPHVPLTYEIPFKVLTQLLCLKDDSKHKFWTFELYQHKEKKVTVECCTTLEEFETAAQKFLKEKVIGFDMEWLPRPSKNVW